MSKRNYNVFFNTHTVSGIVISVALYVIFFSGAFALFTDEIAQWEKGTYLRDVSKSTIDYDSLLVTLRKDYELVGRDLIFRLRHDGEESLVSLLPSKDSLASKEALYNEYFSLNTTTHTRESYTDFYSLGEFLYRLHFFSQVPYIGVYLAGFVSFFFLFAIVTGVVVHWKKIVSNFYTFNPKLILKRVWTDAHTALGIIGLPFQFMYAITGAYLGLSILILLPANLLYNSDREKLLEDLRPQLKTYPWIAKTQREIPSVNDFVQANSKRWAHTNLDRLTIKNYGGENMKFQLIVRQPETEHFLAEGRVTVNAFTNEIEELKAPQEEIYAENIQHSVGKLHFGNYGGYALRVVYFILALITCFVIITGVLIWLEARNRKSIPLKKRLYTNRVGHIYMAICLSLFPVIAMSFVFVKLLPSAYHHQKQTILYSIFFISWLLLSVLLSILRNNYKVNKITLFSGAILGFLVPILNGFVTGNWMWKAYADQQYAVFVIDLLWFFLSVIALIVAMKIKPSIQDKSALAKHPIDFKNSKVLSKEEECKQLPKTKHKHLKTIPMRTKISLLWIFIAIGFVFHHIYGLATVFFNESVFIEGSTGETPFWAHQWRIILEGLALTFGLLTLEIGKKWFRMLSFVWAVVLGLFNVYHVITAVIYESSNLSEILVLILLVVANAFLVNEINAWRKLEA
jgi:uncharacterized iron-regulated membrane protein